jgi:hypothetical protein
METGAISSNLNNSNEYAGGTLDQTILITPTQARSSEMLKANI